MIRVYEIFLSVLQSISPGVVGTEIFDSYQMSEEEKQNFPLLKSSDISDAILYVLGTPPHMQVSSVACARACTCNHIRLLSEIM